ncbi:Pr6Pr family membrane protein [Brevundimonas sp.]|uniref:Pr6Pr family membrane protein n=1 Tax=Brevundimonas sp. TaxID=1871086 RepID=UPI002BD78CFE|nr:Pr6Pr family membrane protein [Brevundimonas sp.]HWQ85671.1 Pr6Pr family membrane protein [Brevundimonas sp.]
MNKSRAALMWRGAFALIGWAALALQYGLMITGSSGASTTELTLNFFSFFTILTNVLVAVALTLPVVGNGTRMGRWAASEGVRASVTMYAVVVGLVYHFLLHATWDPQGWSLVANILLHYVMPAAILLDWLLFTPKGRLRWIDAPKWLVFPLVYGGWTLVHGYAAGWWPYWFLNIGELGLARAALYFLGLLVFFLIVGLLVVAIDRTLGRRDTKPASA